MDIFAALKALVVETKRIHPDISTGDPGSKRRKNSNSQKVDLPHANIIVDLQKLTVDIVKSVSVQLNGKSEQTIISGFQLLKEMAVTVPEQLSQNMHLVFLPNY